MSPSEFQNTLNKYLDLHRAYLFRVMIFEDNIVGSVAGSIITELISSTASPVATTTSINVGWQATKTKLAGKTDYQDWNVTVRDDSINAAHTYFSSWKDKVYNAQTGVSSPLADKGGYKRTGILMLMTGGSVISATNAVGMRGYIIHGIWPKEIGQISFDYATESIATFPVTLSVDYYESLSAAQLGLQALSKITRI